MCIRDRTVSWHTGQRRRERHPLDHQVLNHQGIASCKMPHPQLHQGPLSQGDGLPDPHSRQAWYDPRCLHRMVRGPLCNSLFDPAPRIVVSNAGVPVISLANALNPGCQIRARTLTRTIRTKARSRPSRSNKDRSTSPPLQNFLKEHL